MGLIERSPRGRGRGQQDPTAIGPALLDQARLYLRVMQEHGTPTADTVADWRRFYHACDTLIRKFARVYASSANDLDDCAQEVWLKLVDRLGTFEYDPARGRFSTWLYRVVRDTTVSYFRHERRFRDTGPLTSGCQPIDPDADPARLMEREDAADRATRMLVTIRRHISRPNYDLVRMRWLQGRSVDEVARNLGISRKQVWYREHRARKKLRAVFGDPALYERV